MSRATANDLDWSIRQLENLQPTTPHAARKQPTAARGTEAPVVSPALELQKALDDMMIAQSFPAVDYRRGLVRTSMAAVITVGCASFWWCAAGWLTALLG